MEREAELAFEAKGITHGDLSCAQYKSVTRSTHEPLQNPTTYFGVHWQAVAAEASTARRPALGCAGSSVQNAGSYVTLRPSAPSQRHWPGPAVLSRSRGTAKAFCDALVAGGCNAGAFPTFAAQCLALTNALSGTGVGGVGAGPTAGRKALFDCINGANIYNCTTCMDFVKGKP